MHRSKVTSVPSSILDNLNGSLNLTFLQLLLFELKFSTKTNLTILPSLSLRDDSKTSFTSNSSITSSILNNRETSNKKGKNTKISVKGRHDPCVGIRAVPIGEAMMSCVILDHYLLNRAQCS